MIRKIHLDFHTRNEVPDVGAGFDPERFARILAEAHVNMLATPGKCQFGNTYFDTKLGHPHPHLARADMFPATVKACVARGIRVQAYFTLGLDDVQAEKHPDWRQRYRDGHYASWASKHICFASPYVDEVVIPEALDMLEHCASICGFWFDICLYCGGDDGPFFSPWFERAALERLGDRADDCDARWRLGRLLIREACQRIDAAIRRRLPDAENYFNSLVNPGEPENLPLQAAHEVENPILFDGPEVMTAEARWLRCRGRPVIGLVSRFQGPWNDPGTLRTQDQLRFDVGRTVALGLPVSMGDHRHPDGSLDPEVYRRIGAVYGDLERCGPWLEMAAPCREALLLTEIERGAPLMRPRIPRMEMNAARVLEEAGIQFDIRSVDEDDLPGVPLIVWPGVKPAGEALGAKLRAHVARGGALLGMDAAAVGLEDVFGVRRLPWAADAEVADGGGKAVSDCGHVRTETQKEGDRGPVNHFVRALPELGLDGFPRLIACPAPLIEALSGTAILAERVANVGTAPPFPATPVGPFVVQRGLAIYSAAPLFREAWERGAPGPAELLRALIDRLLPRGRVRHSAGSGVTAHLHTCAAGYSLHLVQWALDRWGCKVNAAAEFPALGPIDVRLRLERAPRRVRLVPQGTSLPFHGNAAGEWVFTVPAMKVWQLVGVEA